MTDNQAGLTAEVPTTPQAQEPAAAATTTPPSFMDLVPADYKDKPWVQDFAKSEDAFGAMFKTHENQLAMIGKKATGVEIPAADAAPEAVKAFHKALGVPDSPEGYAYAPPDLSKEPEVVQKLWAENAKDSTFHKDLLALAHEQGMTPKQVQAFAAKIDAYNLNELKATVAATEAMNEQKNAAEREAFNKYYGDKAEAVEKAARETVAKVIPKEVAALGAEIALIHAMNFIHENLYKNDKVGTSSLGQGGMTKMELHSQIMKLREEKGIDGKPIFENKFDPRHKEHFAHVMELYKQHAAMD